MFTGSASSTPGFPASTGFVGRRRELGALRSALVEALAGQGRLVMLAGEPGIGKTRTSRELAAYAETQGAQVLWGQGYEGEGAPPYWPWVQPLQTYLETATPEQLQADLGPGAANMGELLPELRRKLPDLESPQDLEPDEARFRLFNSVTTFLKNISQGKPLVLVLDDLHWADRSSLLLLQFLSQQLRDSPLLVLGTYRDVEVNPQHPLSDTLAQLSREPVFRRQFLQGLSLEDAGAFMELTAGMRPTPQLINTVYARTEGNPFFTAEVVRLLSERGSLQDPERVAPAIPVGVLEVIGRRLNRLSSRCRQTLTTAAVMGREFDFRLLEMLRDGTSEEQLLDVIDEALEAHLIEELPQGRERYQFCHALIQETLTQQLSSSRKVRQHARIAEALEELYGANADAHAAELTHHYGEAQTLLGPEKLVGYSLIAGEQALASRAYEGALSHYERGLVAREIPLSGTEPASDEEAAALLFGLARAKSATTLQRVEAFATLSRSFEYYRKKGRVTLAVAAAEFPIAPPGSGIPGVARLLEQALTMVPPNSHEAGRLLSRYGGVLGSAECNYEGALQALSQAISIARRESDVSLEIQAHTNAAAVCGHHLRSQEGVLHGLRAIGLIGDDANPFSQVISRYWTALNLLRVGEPQAAHPHALMLGDLAKRQSTPRQLAGISFVPILCWSCLEGDWEASREYCDQGLERSPSYPQLLFPRVVLEYETGESDQGRVYLDRLTETMRQQGADQLQALARASLAMAVIARITSISDHWEAIEAAANRVLSSRSCNPRVGLDANCSLALLTIQRDEGPAAEKLCIELEGQRGTMAWTASVDRILGLLFQTAGDLDQSVTHFEDSLSFCRKAGYRPELAWSCHDYAETLLKRSQAGDRENTASLLEEALSISTELGMRPLMERVLALQDRAKLQPGRAPVYPDGLTQREVEVLSLIATGKTDREIADELLISVMTVSTHVRNLLNKTNVANRTEAATYAARHGLV